MRSNSYLTLLVTFDLKLVEDIGFEPMAERLPAVCSPAELIPLNLVPVTDSGNVLRDISFLLRSHFVSIR